MKYLGIDYGSIRVGIAESDNNGKIAFPVTILENNKDLLNDILELIKALNIDGIVIGESLNLNNKENKINTKIKSFAKDLQEKSNKEIIFEKEWLSSQVAKSPINAKGDKNKKDRKQNLPSHIDDKAAAIILQRYLDRINRKDNFERTESLEEMESGGVEI